MPLSEEQKAQLKAAGIGHPELQEAKPEEPKAAEEKATEEPKPAKQARKPKAEAEEQAEQPKVIWVDSADEDAMSRIVLATKEDDVLWDSKMLLPVPPRLINGLRQHGWDASMPLRCLKRGEDWYISQGRTKWRAVPKVNALRKKDKLPPLRIPVMVFESEDEIAASRAGRRLNAHVQDVDPITKAKDIVRDLSMGLSEQDAADDNGVTVEELHGYLLLVNEDLLPEGVQKLVQQGLISFGAAVEFARLAKEKNASEITKMAEDVATMASGGLKVTTAHVKKAAGKGGDTVKKSDLKQWILDLQSDKYTGKHGEAVTLAAITVMEVWFGTRSLASAKMALNKLAKGEEVKFDFAQYTPKK